MAALATYPIDHELNGTCLGNFRIVYRTTELVTTERTQLINITERIHEIVHESGISEGIIHVQSLHTTTGVFVSEWQTALLEDERAFLDDLIARDHPWQHNDPRYSDCRRKNADSHLRGMLLGQSVSLQLRDGRPLLGTWQNIVFGDFDGPRPRSLSVQIMGV